MNYLIYNILFVFTFSFNMLCIEDTAYAESGEDRCHIKSCLCKVTPEEKVFLEKKDHQVLRATSVYFKENEYKLTASQVAYLSEFLSHYTGMQRSISIIGYTDGCGSSEHNKALSQKRAQEVHAKVRKDLYGARVSEVFEGEKSRGHKDSARRVDIIVHTSRPLTTAIEKMPAGYYLVDASGSMWSGYRRWSDVISASVKPDSKVFLSITSGCHYNQRMRSVKPHGGTEIWWSYWNIIDLMKPGETLLIVSDFESQVPLSSREHQWFVKKVKDAGIIVKSVRP